MGRLFRFCGLHESEFLDYCPRGNPRNNAGRASRSDAAMSLTHTDEEGRAKMVDVGDKPVTTRTAIASGFVKMAAETLNAILEQRTPKGDPLEVARLAGIMAAKRTSELIPLCHNLNLTHAD